MRLAVELSKIDILLASELASLIYDRTIIAPLFFGYFHAMWHHGKLTSTGIELFIMMS